MQLPVGPPVRIDPRVDPVALLQARHADAGAREPPGDGGAGGAGADHEHVGAVVGGHSGRWSRTWPESLPTAAERWGGVSRPSRRGSWAAARQQPVAAPRAPLRSGPAG